MELAWRYGFIDFLMPFMIQTTRDLTSKIDYMEKKQEIKDKKEIKEREERSDQPINYVDMFSMGNALQVYTGMPGAGNNMGGGMPGMGMGGGMPGMGMGGMSGMGQGGGFGGQGGYQDPNQQFYSGGMGGMGGGYSNMR